MPFISQEKIEMPCQNQGHNPPDNYYYQGGIRYIWKCPGCGKETIIEAPIVTC